MRTLIANQLGVDVTRVTDEAHFADDLGADWLDRLELMIVIEDRFADVVITDEELDQLEVVGDLIRRAISSASPGFADDAKAYRAVAADLGELTACAPCRRGPPRLSVVDNPA